MQSGACWELTTSARFTGETGCSSWATPTVSGNSKGASLKAGDGLSTQVKATPWLDTLPREVFSFWPTALESNGEKGSQNQKGSKGDLTLPSAVALWPTPVSSGGGPNTNSVSVKEHGHGNNLAGAVKEVTLWQTPTKASAVGGQKNRSGARQGELLFGGEVRMAFGETPNSSDAPTEKTAPLNPDFAEWLMGWPTGWTASQPLATDKFQQWWPLSSKS
jgi:hypothetical protein